MDVRAIYTLTIVNSDNLLMSDTAPDQGYE